ncbi:Hormonally up-regulated neu tumor-associated kinase [Durusdinium trenchii]|uniref:Hormonally up-regulated neu tumor-associated kinase n=1 Tax=Durusdinium trenchii TaxID=1381693 RepID=A0ABP0IKT7_9DINO
MANRNRGSLKRRRQSLQEQDAEEEEEEAEQEVLSPLEAVRRDLESNTKAIEEVGMKIAKVEGDIAKVEGNIEQVIKDLERLDAAWQNRQTLKERDREDLKQERDRMYAREERLGKEKAALRQEKAALRQKEADLREEKAALRKGKAALVAQADEMVEAFGALSKVPELRWGKTATKTSKKSTGVPPWFAPDFVIEWRDLFATDSDGVLEVPGALRGDIRRDRLRWIDGNSGTEVPAVVEAMMQVVFKRALDTVLTVLEELTGERINVDANTECFVPASSVSTRRADIVGRVVDDEQKGFVVEVKTRGSMGYTGSITQQNVPLIVEGRLARSEGEMDPPDKGVDGCPVTQLCMYMRAHKLKYGILTTYQRTWFVVAGSRGDGDHKRAWHRGCRPCKVVRVLADNDEPTFRAYPDEMNVRLSSFVASKAEDARKAAAESRTLQGEPDAEWGSLLCQGRESIARGRGRGCSELKHEIDVNRHLVALQGSVIPRLLYGGAGNNDLLVAITQDDGFDLASKEGRRRALAAGPQAVSDSAIKALKALHSAGVTHNDVAPRNLLVSATGAVKFIDLGRATLSKNGEEAFEKAVAADLADLKRSLEEIFAGEVDG